MGRGGLWIRWDLSSVYAALTVLAMAFYGYDLIRSPLAQVEGLYALLGGVSMLSIGFGYRRLLASRADSPNGPGLTVLGYFLFPAAYSLPGLAVLSEMFHPSVASGSSLLGSYRSQSISSSSASPASSFDSTPNRRPEIRRRGTAMFEPEGGWLGPMTVREWTGRISAPR